MSACTVRSAPSTTMPPMNRHDGKQENRAVEAESVGECTHERERDRVAHQMDEEEIGAGHRRADAGRHHVEDRRADRTVEPREKEERRGEDGHKEIEVPHREEPDRQRSADQESDGNRDHPPRRRVAPKPVGHDPSAKRAGNPGSQTVGAEQLRALRHAQPQLSCHERRGPSHESIRPERDQRAARRRRRARSACGSR